MCVSICACDPQCVCVLTRLGSCVAGVVWVVFDPQCECVTLNVCLLTRLGSPLLSLGLDQVLAPLLTPQQHCEWTPLPTQRLRQHISPLCVWTPLLTQLFSHCTTTPPRLHHSPLRTPRLHHSPHKWTHAHLVHTHTHRFSTIEKPCAH